MTQRLPRRRRSQSGSALVEMALTTPFLILIMLGAGDYCRMLYFGITLAHAARAGAQFGAQSLGHTGNNAGMQAAAQAEAINIGTITTTPTRICKCLDGTVVNCATGTCTGYGVPQVAVRVTTTATFTTIVDYPGIPHSVVMTRVAEIRVK
jgi:Flp pilus assembly protein TadG